MQSSFSDLEYAAKKKLTRRDRFLAGIHAATPWAALEAGVEGQERSECLPPQLRPASGDRTLAVADPAGVCVVQRVPQSACCL